MKTMVLPIILQLVGVAVVFAEIFIPSGGLLGLVAAGLFGYSLFIVFSDVSSMAGGYFLAADIIGLPFIIAWGLKMLAHSPATLNNTLSSQEGVIAQNPDLELFVNKTGEALADLRPSGPARIDNQRVDVVSRGEYIDKGSKIMVVKVRGNQVVVARQPDDSNTIK
nr:serine protease [Desulfobulbaceae bacterium]